MLKFEISDEDQLKINTWLKDTVYPEVIAEQRVAYENSDELPEQIAKVAELYWNKGVPFGGAIGGGLTYHFTNTTIGQVQKVSYGKHELDLTDYASW